MGKKKDPAADQKEEAVEVAEIDRELETITETCFEGAPLQLVAGNWECDTSGVYKLLPKKNSPNELERVDASHQQILPSGILENIETGQQRYIISFSVRRNGHLIWKNVPVEPAICCSKTKIVSLSNLGVAVNDMTAKQLVAYLADMIRLNQERIPVKQAISHLGWVGKRFFPYDANMVFDGDAEQEKVAMGVSQAGDYDIWKTACRFFRKELQVRLIMDASFAAPLVKIIGGLCFVVLLWGTTGTGKTVALKAAASIWGKPDALLKTVDATINYMTNRAALMKNLPFMLDELQLAGNNKDKIVYALAEGIQRGRLGKDGSEKTGKTWETISIITGETPIVDARSGGGAINRVLEVEIDAPLFKDFSYTMDIITENYGHAGKRFIEYIQEADHDRLREEYREICNDLAKYDSTGKQIQNLAFLVLADRIVERCILEGETPLELSEVAEIMKSKKEVSQAERAYQFIVGWIAMNKNHFEDSNDTIELYGKMEGGACFVNKVKLEQVLNDNGYSFDAVKKEWDKLGYLKKNNQGRYHHYTSAGNGQKAMYIKICFDDPDRENKTFVPLPEQQILPFC